MKLFLLLLLTTTCLTILAKKEKCETVTQEDCENMTSEYEKYRACMERRTKRSADCYEEDSCDSCDCNTCSYSSCDDCSYRENNCCAQCCQSNSCTTSNCCHQTCRAECRSNSCRTSCKKRCQDRITSVPVPITSAQMLKSAGQHNITTVIHLNNVINNTNLINLPINVNNTVLNNITNDNQYSGGGGGYFGSYIQQTSQDKCCTTVGPRQCVPQKDFPFMRCFHLRRKACGSICTAPVVHYQKHEVCDNDVNIQQPCHQQIIYVPQPQPRCAYQSTWPYVTCGNSEAHSCDGCYDHYIKREDLTRCSNFCYDDGYGVGPYYRQGPFYRPGFAHAPSCYQTGTCGYGYGYGMDYGYGYGEGLPENGFPNMYPPQTYPFVIEDNCENCTGSIIWENSHTEKSIDIPTDKIQWDGVDDKMINIDATVNNPRTGRYAEIRIKPTKKHHHHHKTSTTTQASRTTTASTTTSAPTSVSTFSSTTKS